MYVASRSVHGNNYYIYYTCRLKTLFPFPTRCIQVRYPQLACRVPHHLLPLIRCIYCLWDHYRYFRGSSLAGCRWVQSVQRWNSSTAWRTQREQGSPLACSVGTGLPFPHLAVSASPGDSARRQKYLILRCQTSIMLLLEAIMNQDRSL